MSNSEIILVIASALLAYTYIGYPVILTLLPKKGVRDVARHRFTPSVTVLVVAHNEAHCIDRKIEDILNLEYDNKNLQIVIGSDGSTDATEAIATRYRDFGVQVVNFSVNRGKPAVINELIPTFTSDIVVLMDSRQSVAKDALQKLVNEFIDPAVGAVSGELMLTSQTADTPALDGVGFYWRYEKYIRLNESRLDSSVGVTGAFYAFRRELFNPIPESTLLDDVLIPMQIARKGYRVLFSPGAMAYDVAPSEPDCEFRRKVRTLAGNFQLFHKHCWLLNPFSNRLWFQTFSHKFLRLLGPFLLGTAFLANFALLDMAIYRALFTIQCLIYCAAAIGYYSPAIRNRLSVVSVPYAFCLLNWSTAVGFYRYVRGEQRVTWKHHHQSA